VSGQFSIKPSTGNVIYRLNAEIGEADGFAQLGRLYAAAIESPADTLTIDFRSIQWIDAHLAAGYAAIIQLLKFERNIKVNFINIDPKVREILAHHGITGFRPEKRKESVIPVTVFQPGGSKDFAAYSQTHFARMPIPLMTPAVKEKFFEGIDELFSNAEIHSKTKLGIYACGQFFPWKNKIDFSIVDLGIGFERGVNGTKNLGLSDHGAIEWAMTGTNTTRSGDIPGGLGLKLLKDFVGLNKGKFTVISYAGIWCLGLNGVGCKAMQHPFPGTAITLEINTADRNSYYMTDEAQRWEQRL
jgi:hypothetical protein